MFLFSGKKASIARRLSTSLVVCISIICIIFISLTYYKKQKTSNELLSKKAREYQELITSSLKIPLWDIDRDNIRDIGKSYIQNNDLICRLYIFDPMNRIIFSQEKEDNLEGIRLAWNIVHKTDFIGRIEMDISSDVFSQKNKAFFISGMQTLLLVIIMISLTTGFFLNAVLRKPFQELNTIVQLYSSGQYDSSKTQSSYIEFEQFVNVLNQMAEKIIKQNETLEQRVIERTQKLNQANEELKNLAVLADEANTAKGEFLTNVSHELRTPMNGILGMSSVLMDLVIDDGQLQCVKIIQDSAYDLLSLINDLLDFSSLDTGRFKLKKLNFDLTQAIDMILELFHLKAKSKNLQLTHTISNDVPTALIGDSVRLQQIIANLIDNGIKFSDAGTVHLDISLQLDSPTYPVLCFSISDTGIGIDHQDMKHLFKLFSQVDASVTRKYGGTGLGLIIAKNLVSLMDGEISVKSQKDKGSTFWFTACFEKQGHTSEDI
ncbi:MAG: hypothetical protein HQK75_17280 [Candidatus Magnetomorum sp.]|nr:hypothetical protein [Candidatus Magnetomorum sp.]